jgi:Skp family chaperone for outer membrane proteins
MKELNFDFEQKQIKINGHVFDILKADTDVMEKTAMLQKQAGALQKEVGKNSAESKMAVAKTIRDVIEYVDEVLGNGANEKDIGGKPVGFAMGRR